ncbi:FlgK family flagellar hook-associated protein [Desulforamulus hydrothermalis]|uniref:Flagellar hook-associated protein 1 n=1 Tax=Desulforamulus hydrothermalis Lam5 = DSM 18033 TaxID=1121428 RepID=K8E0M5_9FIRM
MPGTWFGLEIAKRGVMSHRTALDVTGHNIANANTEGYSRQEAVLKPTDPWTLPDLATKMLPGQLGTGVSVEEVRRIRDYYLDVQSRQSGSYEGYWEKRLDLAKRMETVFPEPDGRGLQAVLLNFFNDWQDVNNNPADPGVKKAVIESADELAGIFRQMHTQLSTIGEGIAVAAAGEDPPGYFRVVGGMMSFEADKINLITKRIADLSNTIIRLKQNGASPNDLLDQRDALLDELAKYGNIKTTISDGGQITVSFIDAGGSFDIVKMNNGQAEAGQVAVFKDNSADPHYHLLLDYDGTFDAADAKLDLTARAVYSPLLAGSGQGSLLGLEAARQDNAKLLKDLDDLALKLVELVNGGATDSPPGSGIEFFDASATGAADIKVKAGYLDIIGQNAINVARLRSTLITVGSVANTTFENFYQGIVAQVGANVDHYANMLENQQAIGSQIEALRQSVSGVSVDEELTRMIQFQYGYQASARMLALQDELLDYLINRIR